MIHEQDTDMFIKLFTVGFLPMDVLTLILLVAGIIQYVLSFVINCTYCQD